MTIKLIVLFLNVLLLNAYKPDYNIYHNLSTYYNDIYKITSSRNQHHTRLLHLSDAYTTVGGHKLHVVHVTDFLYTNNHDKIRVLMSFGEHAREMIVVEEFFDLIKFITSSSSSSSCLSNDYLFSQYILRHFDIHLIGMINPDGRHHIEQTGDFCYRNTDARIGGVDINRNFDWMFKGPASTTTRGSEEYSGPKPFSIAETQLIRDLQDQYKYDVFVSLHSGEQQIFCPFVDSKSKRIKRQRSTTRDEIELINSIMKKTNSYFHDSGIAYKYNSYSADGAMFDWMAGIGNVSYSLCVETWGGPVHPDCFVQFNPPSVELHNTLKRIRKFWRVLYTELLYRIKHIKIPSSTTISLEKQLNNFNKFYNFKTNLCNLEHTFANIRRKLLNIMN